MRTRRARVILAAGSALVALVCAEVGLRVAGVSFPNFYRPDANRGWSLQPGAEGWWRREGAAYVRINGAGLRDEEHRFAKPKGEVRIAVLGDSCTEALQVPIAETFWERMEGELARCPAAAGRAVEAVNFGVAGYGTAQELLTLRHEVWRYEPDLVLLAFYTGNDVRNNERRLEQDPSRPYFTLRPDSTLALDDSFLAAPGFRLRRSAPARLLYAAFNHVRLLQLGKVAQSAVDGWVGSWKARRVENNGALQELGLDNAVYSPPADAAWNDAWRATEAMIRVMRDETAAHGARFAVVTLSNGIQVHPDPAVRRDFMRRLGLSALFYPDHRLRDFGQAHHIPVLNLAPPLQDLATRRHLYLHGFPNTPPGQGHWNSQGHAAAAHLLAPWLCPQLPPPQP
ncbi:MAG TPA: SGNH/GDSL hydrolase family protein [Thermoanaerobaculia bacterium]|nr:SGNH/GDSL hydrolase family protein [Thermoanaerobaculia bacterium]